MSYPSNFNKQKCDKCGKEFEGSYYPSYFKPKNKARLSTDPKLCSDCLLIKRKQKESEK